MATIVGTSGNDRRSGTAASDRISLLAGLDVALGLAGNDTLYGGNDADSLYGGDDSDRMFGGTGSDSLYGGNGNDIMLGGTGLDRLFGGDGNDSLRGDEDSDRIDGGAGNDRASGGDGNDVLLGVSGNDTLDGGTGSDTLFGGNDDDRLSGAADADRLSGGSGNDRVDGGDGNDIADGGEGNDIVLGGNGADTLNGAAGSDSLYGGADADRLSGGEGNDRLEGGAGNDLLFGGAGTDRAVFAGSFADFAIGWASGGVVRVRDLDRGDGDLGTDLLDSVESLYFGDRIVDPRDLDLDIVIGAVGEANPVLVNQGGRQGGSEGSFAEGTDLPGGSLPTRGLALGDLDGDGDLDVLLGNFAQPNQVLVNRGGQGGTEGTFAVDADAVANTAQSTWAVALGDVDGDGDLDALLGNIDRANQLLINAGGRQGGTEGNFQARDLAGGSQTSRAVALADLDGDGDLDAVIGNHGLQANQILVNQGGRQGGNEGAFTPAANALPGGANSTSSLALGDVDNDGDVDIVVGNGNTANQLVLNQGGRQGGTEGSFALAGDLPGGSEATEAVALGDLDGDGDLDLVVGNYNAANRILINQGGAQGGTIGSFVAGTAPGGVRFTESLGIGDLDGDGDLDVAVGNRKQATQVMVNQGGAQGGTQGSFVVQTAPGGEPVTFPLALGDLDGDGFGGLSPSGLPILGGGVPLSADVDWIA